MGWRVKRDAIERADRLLRQGVPLEPATVRELVDFALGNTAIEHADGCGWWRGSGCTCRDALETARQASKTAAGCTNGHRNGRKGSQ
jgi:hypothetical protein